MEKQTIAIGGMTCAACANRIQKAVWKLQGIVSASVNFATEKLSVEYDADQIALPDIEKKIIDIGYNVLKESAKASVTIPIAGMTCAACVNRVEKAVSKVGGVLSVSVNFATENATISYDPQKARMFSIRAAIDDAGYKALEAQKSGAVDEHKIRKEQEIRSLRRKAIVAGVFGAPLMYLAMVPMVEWLSWLPFPRILNPMQFPLHFIIVQILLCAPIVTAGRNFYTVGFKALFQRSPNMDSLIAIGTSAAVVYSLWSSYDTIFNLNFGSVDHLYFESAGVIIALVLLGKTLEAISKGKTSEAIKKLMGLAPKTATVIHDGKEIEIPIDEVEIGQVILARPGGKIPVDGVITEGHSAVDESMLTG